jgi:alginate production protein
MTDLAPISTAVLFALALLACSGVSHAQDVQPLQGYVPGSELTRRPDDRRPADQLTLRLFNRPLTVGGELEIESRYEGNFTLRDDTDDDIFRLSQELALEFFYPFTEDISFFLEGIAFYENDLYIEDSHREFAGAIELGEAWVYMGNLWGSRFSLQVGRQYLWEERNWWWDDYLEAVRLYYDRQHLQTELAVAREVGRVSTVEGHTDPEARDVLRLLGNTAWNWAGDQWLDGFFLYHHDHSSRQSVGRRVKDGREDPGDAELLWLGARASGELDLDRFGELEYVLEGAWVGGSERVFDFEEDEEKKSHWRVSSRTNRAVTGWALNVGVSWETELPGQPTLTLEYALGSGDRTPERGTDRAFRQTGLSSNEGRFDGVNYFDYYGVLLQPELSNLHIWTAAIGFSFWQSSSVEFVYHLYHQVHPAPFLRDASIDADPTGTRRMIGQEWDVIIGLQEWKHLEIELIGGFFRAGPAYGPLSGEIASRLLLEIDFNF